MPITLIVMYFVFSETPLSELLHLPDPFLSPPRRLSPVKSKLFSLCLQGSASLGSCLFPNLPAKAGQNDCHTGGFASKYSLVFGEDGWVIASENKPWILSEYKPVASGRVCFHPLSLVSPSFSAPQQTSDPTPILSSFFINTYTQSPRPAFIPGMLFPRCSKYFTLCFS